MRHIGRLMDYKVNVIVNIFVAAKKKTLVRIFFRALLFIVYAAGSTATIHAQEVKNKIIQENLIGWLDGHCFAVKNADIVSGTTLIIVGLENKQKIIHAKIIQKTTDGSECHALLADRRVINLKGGTNFYTVSSKKTIELGIGIIKSGKDIAISEKQLLDLSGNGRKNTFNYCSTAEGVQFTVWSGLAYKSNLIWSGYYYLGYDTQLTCPPLPDVP
ncbi:hypothetical protein AAKU61_001384 [Undibacterium sp. GrIS 1.2]|uniref:hypothetical protein n=1 Tax=Undibacterium sp. GrIS 1.2 TaxID=3143933 RepID=UPI0033984DB7